MMTRKILSFLLALVLVTGIASAMAESYQIKEDFKSFDVTVKVPEGYVIDQVKQEGWSMVSFHTEDPNKANFDITVAPSEDFEGKSLGEFTDEEKQEFVDNVTSYYDTPSHEFFTTPSGNLILFTQDTGEGGSYATMQTIYHGYYYTLYGCYDTDFRPLTEADIAIMHEITEGTDIISVPVADAAQ